MRTSVAVLMLLLGYSYPVLAQSGPGGGGPSSSTSPSSGPRAPSAAPSTSATPAPLQPSTSGASTPSQQNLDIAPPTRNLPNSQGNAVTPQPPQKGASPGTVPPQDNQVPPPSGGNARFEPGGAKSSQPGGNRTGKNALSESYRSCLNIWDAGIADASPFVSTSLRPTTSRSCSWRRSAVDRRSALTLPG